MMPTIKRMKYSNDHYVKENEILRSIKIKASSCPAILSSASGCGNSGEPKALLYKNVSNVFNDGGNHFNKKTGIYDGVKMYFLRVASSRRDTSLSPIF